MKIAVYHNLTFGGGKKAFLELEKRLSLKHYLTFFNLNIKVPGNFFSCQAFIYTSLKKIYLKLAKEIDKGKYDAVFVSHDYLTKSPYLLRYLKTPSVYLCQESWREFYEPSNIFASQLKSKIVNFIRYPLKKVDQDNVKKATMVVANSDYSKMNLKKIYQRQIEKISLGVDNKKFKNLGFKRKSFFLSVGSLAKYKGMDFLIRSISLLPSKIRYPLVIVAADGGLDEKYIKNLALQLKLKLIIKSKVNNQQLIKLYNQAKLFLFAPYNEPFGLVTLEAMACGLPVVGVNQGGLKEVIINGKNGWLTNRDENEFSLIIINALKQINLSFRKQTTNLVKKWNWDKSTTELEKILFKASKLK